MQTKGKINKQQIYIYKQEKKENIIKQNETNIN